MGQNTKGRLMAALGSARRQAGRSGHEGLKAAAMQPIKPAKFHLVVCALSLFFVTTVGTAWIISRVSPLGALGAEDHFQIGQNLRAKGTLTVDQVPSLFRPPGYPAFVAFSLLVADCITERAVAQKIDGRQSRSLERDANAVLLAHSILLGTLAAIIFLTAAYLSCSLSASICVGLMAAFNPYSLAVATVLSYPLLFITSISLSTLVLVSVLRGPSAPAWPLFGSGILWGATSLIKPVMIILPPFLAILFLLLASRRRAMQATLFVTLGMCLSVLPYVIRNYLVSGHAIITAQGGFAIWGSSVEKIREGHAFLEWEPIWWGHGMPIFSRVTGSPQYSNALLNAYAVQLNQEFMQQAIANIMRHPGVYLYNVARNFVAFNLDNMSFWLDLLLAHNRQPKPLGKALAAGWIFGLSFLSIVGACWAAVNRDRRLWVFASLYMALPVGHSISFAMERYTDAKLPLLLLGTAVFIRQIYALPFYGRSISDGVAVFMASLGLMATVLTFF